MHLAARGEEISIGCQVRCSSLSGYWGEPEQIGIVALFLCININFIDRHNQSLQPSLTHGGVIIVIPQN